MRQSDRLWIDPTGGWQVYYKVSAVDHAGNESDAALPEQISSVAALPPSHLRLLQNTPNPFNPVTTIRFEVLAEQKILLRVFDASGALVRTLLACEVVREGRHETAWSGRTPTACCSIRPTTTRSWPDRRTARWRSAATTRPGGISCARWAWGCWSPARAGCRQLRFGKTVIATDNTDWTTAEIVSASLDRWQVEDRFRQSKDHGLVGVQPVRHWTDGKIRCHLFTCVAAMTYLRRLELRLAAAGMDDMRHLHSMLMLPPGARKPRRRLETPSKTQAEVLSALGWRVDEGGVLQAVER